MTPNDAFKRTAGRGFDVSGYVGGPRPLTTTLASMASALARVLSFLAIVAPLHAIACEVLEEIPHPGSFNRECPHFPCPPAYPQAAIRERLEGDVVLSVHVAADGAVLEAKVVSSSAHSVLDEAAVRYVRASHFPVYTPTGSSASACYVVRVPIAFRFDNSVDGS